MKNNRWFVAWMATTALVASSKAAEAACTATNATQTDCSATSIVFDPAAGTSSLTVTGVNSVGLFYSPPTSVPDGNSFTESLTITGSTLSNPSGQFGVNTGAAISMVAVDSGATSRSALNASAMIGGDVLINSRVQAGGAVLLRTEFGGNVSVNNAGTIISTGVNNSNVQFSNAAVFAGTAFVDGINAVTNQGTATIVNSGTVTANSGRGLYADGNAGAVAFDGNDNVISVLAPQATVSIDNTATGHVDAYIAGLRAIDYYGLSQATNEGYVHSTAKQAIVAWSASGDASIGNSGTAVSDDQNAIVAETERGNATITNSGAVTAGKLSSGSQGAASGYSGLRAFTDHTGDITITNASTGVVTANFDAAVVAHTPQGTAKVVNQGQLAGLSGVFIDSGAGLGAFDTLHDNSATAAAIDGTAQLINSGSISAVQYGAYLHGATNLLDNSGTISASGGTGGVVELGAGGAITNSGLINGAQVGLRLTGAGSIGSLNNSGTITGGAKAVAVDAGGVLGSLTNSGTISGPIAIDTTGAGAAVAISQTGGAIIGAVNLSPTFADHLEITGGTISGAITGTAATVDFGSSSGAGQTYILNDNVNVRAINVLGGRLLLGHDVTVAGALTNSAMLEVDTARTITGDYAQSAGAALVVGVNNDSGAVGKLVVTHNATIASGGLVTVQALGSSVSRAAQTYTIVSAGNAGSYAGTALSSVQVANPFLPVAAALSASGNDLILTLTPSSGVPFDNTGPTTPGQQQVNGALTSVSNSQRVATALTALYQQNGSFSTLPVLVGINNYFNDTASPLSQAQKIQVVASQLTPSNAAIVNATQSFSSASTTAVVQHLQTARARDEDEDVIRPASVGPQNSVWGQAIGFTTRRASTGDNQGDRTTSGGVAMGADTLVRPGIKLGATFAYAQNWANGLDLASGNSTHIESFQLGGYGSYSGQGWYANGQVAVGFDRYDQSRTLSFMSGAAKARYSGLDTTVHADVGKDFYAGATQLTPIASLTYLHQTIDGYTESLTNESMGKVGVDNVQSELGLQGSWLVPMGTTRVQPTVKVGWLHDWVRGPIAVNANLGGVSFTTFSERPSADGLDAGVALTVYDIGAWQLQAQYDGNFSRDYTSHALLLNMKLHF